MYAQQICLSTQQGDRKRKEEIGLLQRLAEQRNGNSIGERKTLAIEVGTGTPASLLFPPGKPFAKDSYGPSLSPSFRWLIWISNIFLTSIFAHFLLDTPLHTITVCSTDKRGNAPVRAERSYLLHLVGTLGGHSREFWGFSGSTLKVTEQSSF